MDINNDVNKREYADNPRNHASLISRLGFCWILPLIKKGYNKDLDEDDLFEPLAKHTSSSLGDQLEEAWQRQCSKNPTNPSLWKALISVFGLEFGLFGIMLIFLEGCKMSQPMFLSRLLGYFRDNQTDISRDEAILYAGLISAVSLFNVLGGHTYLFGLQQIGMKMRVACCSLIYRKSLRLSKKAMGDTTVGQIVNLTSNDVSRFDSFVINFHNLWFVPIEFCTISVLLCYYIGITSLVGVGFLLLYLPMQIYLGERFSMLRLKTALRTDERVRLMNEVITGIQVIKMYTWEKPFSKLIDLARRLEIRYIRKTAFVNGILFSLGIFTTRFTLFLTLLTYVLLGNTITPEYVFVTYAFFHMLRQCMTIYFPQGIAQFSETKISVARIKKFLLYNEVEKPCQSLEDSKIDNLKSRTPNGVTSSMVPYILCIRNATAKWSSECTDDTLRNINIEAKTDDLIAIIGSVGGGKSSILQIILKELPLIQGHVDIQGTISYASQEPWIFGGTVRQNILFGEEYNETKYREVIKACALERDLNRFPYGDKTLVGERGIMVSGGQKARINLARAIYKEADIYLLDDPLSAVDTQVGKRLFVECIQGYLKNKCVVLVTHQLQYLKKLSNIILIDNGEIKGRGDYKQIEGLDFDFTKIMKSDNVEDEAEERKLKTLESIHDQLEEQEELAEGRKSGRIDGTVYTTYIKSMGNLFVTITILSLFIIVQIAASGSDYYLTYWLNYEQAIQNYENDTLTSSHTFILQRNMHLYIFTVIIISLMVLALCRSIGFFALNMRASIKLHNKMFEATVYSPMRFFHENSSGRILNRFSKDVGSLDQILPTVLSDTIAIGLNVFGISLLIGVINPWFLLVTCTIMVVFYMMRVIYLKTSRDIKRLETTTRSPVFTHISASLQGLTTIRAFNAQSILVKEFDSFQDAHTSTSYMFLSTSRMYGYWMDLICVAYIAIVTLSFVLIDKLNTGGEDVGLAITQSITLSGTFQWGMRQWSEMENQMTSVERVVEYTNLEKEEQESKSSITKSWPTNGRVEFKHLSMKYTTNGQYVLNDLNLVIESQEKIGVVGRTGAGKTSLISALFQLTGTEGEILIDDVNIRNIPLDTLRSNIAIIPQEPVLFSGTMRKNLDPFDKYQDVDLWDALEEVELRKLVAELPSGLNTRMLEGGTNFSVGQRQLVCLARAIIGQNKILILDEATANVDPQTDYLIQQTIRRKLAACTVITIAHRLNTIIDSDKVLVMAAGYIREYDHPYRLLQIKNGLFVGMVAQNGRTMEENLRKIAENTFQNRKSLQN